MSNGFFFSISLGKTKFWKFFVGIKGIDWIDLQITEPYLYMRDATFYVLMDDHKSMVW